MRTRTRRRLVRTYYSYYTVAASEFSIKRSPKSYFHHKEHCIIMVIITSDRRIVIIIIIYDDVRRNSGHVRSSGSLCLVGPLYIPANNNRIY